MVPELTTLYQDLNFEKLRISRPSKFVFLCGGIIGPDGTKQANSLRDYLYRVQSFCKRLHGEVILAEKANQLYRETSYGDLISFEEDIARIAAVVFVIAESPGSLAELGAFASNEVIRRALRVIVQTDHFNKESFIRWGPIQRIKNDGVEFVGVYPWKTRRTGHIVLRSTALHRAEMVKFVNQHLDAIPKTEQFPRASDVSVFYLIYWVIHLSLAISRSSLYNSIRILVPAVTDIDLRNKIFCMQLAGWIAVESYSGKDYLYTCHDVDPFVYKFDDAVSERDTVRRKIEVTQALAAAEKVPKHVRSVAANRRMVG